LLAWGVLGLQPVGFLFSLLTLSFSGALKLKTQVRPESFADRQIIQDVLVTHLPPYSYEH
jgi:hypothetical protein